MKAEAAQLRKLEVRVSTAALAMAKAVARAALGTVAVV